MSKVRAVAVMRNGDLLLGFFSAEAVNASQSKMGSPVAVVAVFLFHCVALHGMCEMSFVRNYIC